MDTTAPLQLEYKLLLACNDLMFSCYTVKLHLCYSSICYLKCYYSICLPLHWQSMSFTYFPIADLNFMHFAAIMELKLINDVLNKTPITYS